jgi:putative peptidoglycan lipid II flippase
MFALMTSRVLGVVRQVIFNALFGAGAQANAYYAAARLPDTLYSLIAGGALINAFVPVFLSYERDKGEEEAWRLTSLVFNLVLVVLTVVLLGGEFCAPAFVNNILIPGYSASEKALTTDLTRIMLLQPLFLGLGTVISAILNSRRQFLLPALSLAVYNIGLISGLLVAKWVPAVGIYGPTYGVVAAALIQLLALLPGLFKQGMHYSFTWNMRHPGLHQVLILLLPNALAMVGAYGGNIVDTHFASYLTDSASLSALNNAEMLQALPVALIGQAITQSLMPHLTVHATAGRYIRMRQMALKVIAVSIACTFPLALLLALAGKPLIHILFQHGAFDAHAAAVTNLALLGYACSLPGLAAGNLLSGGFFALKDAWTPFITNTCALFVRWGMLYYFFAVLRGEFMILAIPLALAVAATSEAVVMCGLLILRLQRRLGEDKGMQRLERRRGYQREMLRLNQVVSSSKVVL